MMAATATVNSFAKGAGTGIYVGGSFDTGGPRRALVLDDIGLLNGNTWRAFGQGVTYGETAHGIAEALAHGNGSEYVGGWFDQTGSVQTTGIARWDGSTWHSMGSGVAGGVSATGPTVDTILVDGTEVFIGGDFSGEPGPGDRHRRRRRDQVVGRRPWGNGNVATLAMSAGYLYAGGSFTRPAVRLSARRSPAGSSAPH